MQGPEELGAFVAGQLEQRWAVCERPALVAAFRAGGEMDRVGTIDRELEALTLAAELREGSRRAGAALLTVHERIGTAGAADYRAAIRTGGALGHLPVVQGVVWHGAGMDEAAAQAASAHTFCVALLGAALRLGTIGHLQGAGDPAGPARGDCGPDRGACAAGGGDVRVHAGGRDRGDAARGAVESFVRELRSG